MLDFDSVLAEVGDFGPYQLFVYFLVAIPACFPSAWSAFNHVFVAAIPHHRCRLPGILDDKILINRTIGCALTPPNYDLDLNSGIHGCLQYNFNSSADLCSQVESNLTTTGCQDGWAFDQTTYTATIVTQFGLVCHRRHLVPLNTMVFYIGSFIGNILFGYIADKWGRRASFFSILTLQVTFGTASAFAPDIYTFTALRFFVGLTFPALYQIPFIIGMEVMGPTARIFAGIVICIIFGFAMGMLGIIAYCLRNWFSLTLISNTPFALLFLYWWILPESARWLVTAKRYDEATKEVLKIAKWNKRPVDPISIKRQIEEIGERAEAEHKLIKQERHNIVDLFRPPNLRKKTTAISFIWLVNAVVYNGLTYNVSNLGVNDYFAFVINGAVEIPAYIISWPLLSRYGRRWPLAGTMLLGGVACVSCMFVPAADKWSLSCLAFFGKFCNAGSFGIIYIYAGELYPTVVRGLGMGFSSMVAGFGLILAPYLVDLSQISRYLPLCIMGGLTVAAGVTSMFLPETLGAHLPQTIAEAEQFGKGVSFWHHPMRSNKNKPESLELPSQFTEVPLLDNDETQGNNNHPTNHSNSHTE